MEKERADAMEMAAKAPQKGKEAEKNEKGEGEVNTFTRIIYCNSKLYSLRQECLKN